MSVKTSRSETIRLIDQNTTDFIVDRKKSNNLVEIIGYLEVDCSWRYRHGHNTTYYLYLYLWIMDRNISVCLSVFPSVCL